MGGTIDELGIIRRRLAAQRLTGEPFPDPATAVRSLLAVQSQEYLMAKWAVAMRSGPLTDAAVEQAFDAGAILRTHVLRPTWHFVAPEDIRPLLRLTAPRIRRLLASQDRELELDEPALAVGRRVVAAALRGGTALTRPELAERLVAAGIAGGGRRIAHIAMRLELEELICSGPRRGRQHTYMLLDERAPEASRPADGEGLLAAATERFFASHGPATAHDFAKWASLRVADARRGLELAGDSLDSFEHAGKTWWQGDSPEPADDAGALFLPDYDESMAGYRDLRVQTARPVPEGFSLQRPVLVGGEVQAAWRRTVTGRAVDLEVQPLGSLSRRHRAAIEAEADRYAWFLQLPIGSLRWVAS